MKSNEHDTRKVDWLIVILLILAITSSLYLTILVHRQDTVNEHPRILILSETTYPAAGGGVAIVFTYMDNGIQREAVVYNEYGRLRMWRYLRGLE